MANYVDSHHEDRELTVDELMRSSVIDACRWLEIDEAEYWAMVRASIIRATTFLRSPNDAANARVAQLLQESGVDLQTAVVPRYHEDGDAQFFGVVVTSTREVYAFDFRWGEDNCPPAEAGIFTAWEILTGSWEQSIYVADVFRGFKALDEGWLDALSQSE